jgi:nucleoside-diphosphate-sugar epimerase
MKILLTGASGFLGSALARHWAGAGHELALLLRPSSSLRRLRAVPTPCRIYRCADDLEITAMVADFAPDAVVHTACRYGRKGETALEVFDTNVRLGIVLLQALLSATAERACSFLHAGSVLGSELGLYALSKAQFAQWGMLLAAQAEQPLRFIEARLQHMYGPDDDPAKFSTQVMHACHHQVERLALTPGEQRRDFVHIDDVVGAFDILLRQAGQLAKADAVDVGSGQAPTIRQFVETVHVLCRSRTRLDFGARSYRANEAMHCQADTTRLRALGWQCRHDLRSGLRQTLELEFGR